MRTHITSFSGRYFLALLTTALAASVRLPFEVLGATLPFATFFPAVMVSALFGGTGPGVLSVLLSMAFVWFWLTPPEWSFEIPTQREVWNHTLFAISAACIIWFADAFNKTRRSRELAMRELEHRNKNLSTVIEAVILQSLRDTPELAGAVRGRVHAVLATHDIMHATNNLYVDLETLVRSKIEPFGRGRTSGPKVTLPPTLARHLSLVFHELCTNAAKYGAFSSPDGLLLVQWECTDEQVHLTWRESGGPEVKPPSHHGFGTRLVSHTVRAFDGHANPHFHPQGFVLSLSFNVREPKTPRHALIS